MSLTLHRDKAVKRPGKGWFGWYECGECGNGVLLQQSRVRCGVVKTCGCVRGRRRDKHHHSGSPTYVSWCAMRQRCNNPNSPVYGYYGGRGIRVCPRWDDFAHFLADLGERPEGTTLDRIDSDGHYEPGNVRWATPRQQTTNRPKTLTTEVEGETVAVRELARKANVSHQTVFRRLARGWALHDALTTSPYSEKGTK